MILEDEKQIIGLGHSLVTSLPPNFLKIHGLEKGATVRMLTVIGNSSSFVVIVPSGISEEKLKNLRAKLERLI
jgi:hypothetical protein